MAKARTWMPLYPADFISGTIHLDAAETGAYMLLLMAYWMNGGPLPLNQQNLSRICRMDADEWGLHMHTILRFFHIEGEEGNGGVLRHKRVDDELVKAKANFEAKSAASRSRWNASASVSDIESTKSASTSDVISISPSPSPSPLLLEKEAKPSNLFFQAFWDAWPRHFRKSGKPQCLTKWKTHGLDALAPMVMASLNSFKSSPSWAEEGGKYIPAPLTWLNQARWEAAPQALPPIGGFKPAPNTGLAKGYPTSAGNGYSQPQLAEDKIEKLYAAQRASVEAQKSKPADINTYSKGRPVATPSLKPPEVPLLGDVLNEVVSETIRDL